MHEPKIFELEKSAEAGDPEAQYALAELCLSPDSKLVQNFPAGVYWLEKAAAQNHANALFRLGQLHESGTYVLKEARKTEEYYLAAAAHHHPEAWRWFEEKEGVLTRMWLRKNTPSTATLASSAFENLPREVILCVIKFLDPTDILSTSLVCKFLRHIAFDSSTTLGNWVDERCEKYAKTRLAYEKFSLWDTSERSPPTSVASGHFYPTSQKPAKNT